MTMGDWSGTGYIVTNPETGAGAYMISGGLNGGAASEEVTLAYMVDVGFSLWDMAEIRELGEDFVDRMLREMDDVTDLGK